MKIKLHEDPSNVEVGEFCGDYFATPLAVGGFSGFRTSTKTESMEQNPDPGSRWLRPLRLPVLRGGYRPTYFIDQTVFLILLSSQFNASPHKTTLDTVHYLNSGSQI